MHPPAPILPSGEPRQGVVLHHAQFFPVFYRVSIPIYAKIFAIIELLKKIRIFFVSITNSKEKENDIMLTYDEFKEGLWTMVLSKVILSR